MIQPGCAWVPEAVANIIFIEKRRSFPASFKNACAFLISRSDRQCFSHEDGCFAAGSDVREQPGCPWVPEAGANIIFIEKRYTSSPKKASALYIKTRRWYDLKLDARGNAVL